MRKVTATVVSAFIAHRPARMGNTSTDGQALFLHGNKIAEHRPDGLWVTLSGWNTPTTRERLNALPGVSFSQKAFVPLYHGREVGASDWVKAL